MQKKNNVRVMLAMSFLQGMVFYASIATLYRQATGVTVFQITLIESISLLVSMVLEVPWGMLADRIGYRKTMIVSTFVYFASKVIFWQAESFGGFLAERILLAVALSGLSGVDESILYASCDEREVQKVFGRSSALGTAGLMAASVIYTLFIGENYRLAALLTVASYGLAALLSLFLTETKQPSPARHAFSGFRESLHQLTHARGLLPLILCGAVFGEVIQCITVFFNQLQYERCGWSGGMIGAAYILSTVMEMSSAGSDGFTRRLGQRKAGLTLLIVSAGGCILLALTRSGWLSLACILLLCLSSALFGPLSAAMENQLITVEDRATALSMSSLLRDSAAVMLNLLLGQTADVSLPGAFLLCGGLCVAASVLFKRAAKA